jgi:iron complex outermembrane receptor protein
MHKFQLVALFFLVTSFSSFSQSTYKLKGLLSSEDEAVPFASVLVKKTSDSSVVKVGISDTLGIYNVTGIVNGNYFSTYKSVGFEDRNSEPFEIKGADLDLGETIMIIDGQLSTVTVTQVRPVVEIHPDKTVFNVDNTINATGSNGFDLLRKAPGVIIDNNNNIIVEGKSGVQVYIDNKPSILAGDDLINFLPNLMRPGMQVSLISF